MAKTRIKSGLFQEADPLKMNRLQRLGRRFREFRLRYPYGFIFTVSALATLPALAAIGIMIMFPPATPAILGGAAAMAAHLGLAASIPAFVAVSVLASAVVGGIFAGVKRGFAGISGLFRKPLLVSEVSFSESSADARRTPAKKINVRSPLSPITSSPLPAAPSSSAVLSQPVALEPEPELQSQSQPEPTQLPDITLDLRFQAYKEAKHEIDQSKNQIKSKFDEMLKLANNLNSSLPRLKYQLIEAVKSLKNDFMRGGYDGCSTLNAWVDQLLEKEPHLANDLNIIKSRMSEINDIINSAQYKSFTTTKSKLSNLQDRFTNSMADDVEQKRIAALNGLSVFSTFNVHAEADQLKREKQSVKRAFGATRQ